MSNKSEGTVYNKNSEILFIYDAKLSNPNGDMDNENKPRMDYDTNTNLVSDVRLKRYIRDYYEKFIGEPVFVTENIADAEAHVESILKRKPSKNAPITENEIQTIKNKCIDIKLFGAVFGTAGGNDHITGPVQFNWGYSLNEVELCQSKTITSSFSSGEGVGKDYRVNYSCIAFNGTVNGKLAKLNNLGEDVLKLFDKVVINAVPFCKTHTKQGQTPRLYLRVESENKLFLKDLREYVSFNPKAEEYKVRSIKDYELDLTHLSKYLEDKNITNIYYWKDDKIQIKGWDELVKNRTEINPNEIEELSIAVDCENKAKIK